MPLLYWRDDYSTNIKDMDNQHKSLFDKANELYESIDTDDEKYKLRDTLDFLIKYADFHFKEEEKLLRKHNFPEYEKHKKEHDLLLKKTLEFQNKFINDELDLNEEFIGFFKKWIVNHILTEDRKYAVFLN